MLATDDSGPLRRAYDFVRGWLRSLVSARARREQRQTRIEPWRARLLAWSRWLSRSRFWDSRAGSSPLEVRGWLAGNETLLVCSPSEGGRYASLRLEVSPQGTLPPGAALDRAQPEVAWLERRGFRVMLLRGSLIAMRGRARLESVEPRFLRDAFEQLTRLLEGIEPWPNTRVEARTEAARCPYCHDGLEPDSPRLACASCGTVHHAECAAEMTGCSVFGCRGGQWHRVRSRADEGQRMSRSGS